MEIRNLNNNYYGQAAGVKPQAPQTNAAVDLFLGAATVALTSLLTPAEKVNKSEAQRAGNRSLHMAS